MKRLDAAVKASQLKLPSHPTVSYRVLAKLHDYDPASGNLGATAESWQAMAAGTLWAHVMIEHPAGK
jgi:hypothetical protein